MKATISRDQWVSASAQNDAMLLELSAAATTEILLVDGKAPEWITLIPAGTFQLVDGRGPFHNFNPEGIISASNTRRGRTKLPGDYDHHIDVATKGAVKGIASGWIQELKVEDGAVRARVEWTAAAAKHIRAKEYLYVSPRFSHDDKGNVVSIARFALTNNPAITDLPAIAAAELDAAKMNGGKLMLRLIAALALTASVTEDQVVELVRRLFEKVKGDAATAELQVQSASAEVVLTALSAVPTAGKFVSAAEHQRLVDQLNVLTTKTATGDKARLAAEISAAVDLGSAKGQLPPAMKEFWVTACTEAGSIDPLTNFLKVQPVIVTPGALPLGHRPPRAGGEISASDLTEYQLQICRDLRITPEQFAANRNAEMRDRDARS